MTEPINGADAQARQALDHPHLRRPFAPRPSRTRSTGRTSPRARPASPSPSICRPRPATTPTIRWPRARSARSACRSAISATCGRCSTASRSPQMNTSMTINATARVAAGALRRGRRRAGRRPRKELHGTTQNDIIKEYLSRGTYVFPPGPRMRLTTDMIVFTTARDAEVEPDQRLLLPPAGSRRDAGAGARLSRSPPRSPCSTR